MSAYILHKINGHHFLLFTEHYIYWEEQQAIILSDLHLGKSGHFRKNGIAIPQPVFKDDMQRLLAIIQFQKPKQIIIIGDLFHSRENKELQLFLRWRKDIAGIDFHLVKGNHDILSKEFYEAAGIIVHEKKWELSSFCFTHDILDHEAEHVFCFSGHVHPAIQLKGKGRQHLQVPCFCFSKRFGIMPAFGKFTGTFPITPAKEDTVYAITTKAVIKL